MTKTTTKTLNIKTLLKNAAIAACLTGFANNAFASELSALSDANEAFAQLTAQSLPKNAKIGVARIDSGHLIPTPHGDEFDWHLLDKRVDFDIVPISASDYLKYIPALEWDEADTDNKIDEIRLTAANEGFAYIILYGLGSDAYWGSFGGKVLSQTGLNAGENSEIWDELTPKAQSKALLVESRTGKILGATHSNYVKHHIGELADNVGDILNDLT